MVDRSPSPDPNAGTRLEMDGPSTTGIPRWVKAFVITSIVLVGVLVVLHLTGHNLMNHMPPTRPGVP